MARIAIDKGVLKAALALIRKALATDAAVWFAQQLAAITLRLPIGTVTKAWAWMETAVEEAAEHYPGPNAGEAKYRWVLAAWADFAERVGLDLAAGSLPWDDLLHSVLKLKARRKEST